MDIITFQFRHSSLQHETWVQTDDYILIYKTFYFFNQNKNLSSYQYIKFVFILYELFLLCFGILVQGYHRLNLCWEVRMWSVSMIMSITSVVISELIYVCWNKLLPIIWKLNGKFCQLFLSLSYLYILWAIAFYSLRLLFYLLVLKCTLLRSYSFDEYLPCCIDKDWLR